MTANRRAERSARRRGTMASAERYLVGRVALVTGGASGQGLAIALFLAERGADIAIGSYIGRPRRPVAGADTYWPSDGELSDSCREIEKRGVRAVGAHLDVRSTRSVGAFIRHAQKGLGPIGILVNAAGTSAQQPICGHSERLWMEIVETNLTGCFRTIRACLPGMIERGWGRIINIASTAASFGAKNVPAYCASKSGLLGLTRCVALEGAPHGVTCNAISPGYVNTNLMRVALASRLKREGSKTSIDAVVAEIAESYPQKRIIKPEEVGAIAAFLCRNEARGVTMENITVSAGSLW